MAEEVKRYCAATMILFEECTCEQCSELIRLIGDGMLVPSILDRYIVYKEVKKKKKLIGREMN
jgi:hypothetical protein